MLGTFIIAAAVLAILGPVLKKYWNRIMHWLNNTAADVVEQALGYEARRFMHKAISVADRTFRMINGRSVAPNTSSIYVEESHGMFTKVSTTTNFSVDELGQGYLDEMRTANNIMEMEYRR